MLEAGISSTRETLRFWGIADEVERKRPLSKQAEIAAPPARARSVEPNSHAPNVGGGVQETIEAALRAAGLIR
jgi:hypothetical protein